MVVDDNEQSLHDIVQGLESYGYTGRCRHEMGLVTFYIQNLVFSCSSSKFNVYFLVFGS